ncbi:hypothetical protein Ancab_009146 [Ancistrocladus abbreviatus]
MNGGVDSASLRAMMKVCVGRGMMSGREGRDGCDQSCCFQMPLHYPRYSKSEYETMPEWQLDCLLVQYGLPVVGSVEQKRRFVIGAFLWSHESSACLKVK